MASRFYTVFVALIVSAALVCQVSAEDIDDSQEAVSLYARGKRLLREKSWFDAARVFQELEGRFPNSANIDLFIFNRAKARYYLGEYDAAAAGFNYFITRFPESSSLAHAYHFLGNATYLKGDVNRAVRAYLAAYELTGDAYLEELLVASLVGAFKGAASVSLGEVDFEQLPAAKACALIRPLSEIYLQRGEISRANGLLAVCGEQVDASDLTGDDARAANRELEIALVLPLSGELQSFGQEIYNGAVIATEVYRSETGRSVELASYDSRGEAVEAARIMTELAKSTSTDVVIGPLTSDEAMVSSAVLNCSSLPMIAPAATQAGLTRLSLTSYQLAPNIELEGITLAEYAVRKMQADSVAIISSTAADHLRMTRAFAERFKRLGGTVVAVEYYRPRDTDFGVYIRDIKAILLGQPEDSAFYINADGDTLAIDVVPAYIDCLFMPGDARQLRQLIPQVNFYNLNAFYLGSDGWGDDVVYKLGDDITKGAVFSSPFLEGRQSEQYMKLAAAYDSRYGSRPQRLSALGFDAANLVFSALSGNRATRDDISNGLRVVSNYEGASGMISFGEHRENIEMPLYRIEAELPVLITDEPGTSEEIETNRP
ncbi:MAG: penicillin-binding protein activator [Candidatus Zixiibacteriota bacterium]|nr:MAG: penicillin-binding protein activator [candidate division Zixibacteria bacterium]